MRGQGGIGKDEGHGQNITIGTHEGSMVNQLEAGNEWSQTNLFVGVMAPIQSKSSVVQIPRRPPKPRE